MFYFMVVIIKLDDAPILLCLLHNIKCTKAWSFQSVATIEKLQPALSGKQVFYPGGRGAIDLNSYRKSFQFQYTNPRKII